MTRKYLKRMVGKSVVLHGQDGQSLRGVLTVVARDVLVLESAEHLGANAVQIAGRAVMPHTNFSWAQEL